MFTHRRTMWSTAALLMFSSAVPLAQDKEPKATAKSAATDDSTSQARPTASLNIDLGSDTTQNWPIEPGTYKVILINAIPGQHYSVIVGSTASAQIDPLPGPASGSAFGSFIEGL